jgi:hypothetical protein
MTSSSDLKDALSQRLKRMEGNLKPPILGSPLTANLLRSGTSTASSSVMIGGNFQRSFGSVGTPNVPPSISRTSTFLPVSTRLLDPNINAFASEGVNNQQVLPDIKCEGFLSKYSSGSLTGRWQRRYFILEKGRFGYFKKPPVDRSNVNPDKSFSLRKIKAVFTKDPTPSPSEREISIKIGDITYQLKAATPSEMRKWLSALNTALAHKESFPISDDDDNDAYSSAADMVSVSNSVSSQSSDMNGTSDGVQAYLQQQRLQAASSARKQETVWEVDLDLDELDKLFGEWFKHPTSDDSPDAVSLVKAITLSMSHMYATLGGEMFDAQVVEVVDLPGQMLRAKTVMQSLRRSAKGLEGNMHVRREEDPIKNQLNTVLMEYIPRIVTEVTKFLDHRKEVNDGSITQEDEDSRSTIADDTGTLLPIIDIISVLTRDISAFYAKEPECSCAYCEPDTISKKIPSDSCSTSDRWKKVLRNTLQRLGSEFEVGLIELIQSRMLPVSETWDSPPGVLDTGPCKTTHTLFGSRVSVWLTAWSSTFIAACEEVVKFVKETPPPIRRSMSGGIAEPSSDIPIPFMVRNSLRLASELISSVLVAVLNSAWRQFKHKSMHLAEFAEARKRKIKEISELVAANVGMWSVFHNSQVQHQIRLLNEVSPEDQSILEFQNLVAFANEASLLATFSQDSLPDQLPYIPKIFESCFDGLGVTFKNTASEICAQLVHFHFTEKCYSDIEKAFALKVLQSDIKRTPMIVCRDLTERFANDLVPLGIHPSLKATIVNQLPSAVAHLYVNALLKNRIRIKQYKQLLERIDSDVIIFKSLFTETRFNCQESVVSKAVQALILMHAILAEPKKQVVIEEHSKKLLASFGSYWSHSIATTLLEMRGNDFSKSERTALMAVVDPKKLAQQPQAHAAPEGETVWRF